MAQHGFQIGGHGGSGIDPNDLSNFASSYQNNYSSNHNTSNGFSSGSALFGDDELLDGLPSPSEAPAGMHGQPQDFGGMNDMNMGYTQGMFGSHHGLPVEQTHVSGYSNTPDGDPIQSPFVQNGFGQYRAMPQSFGGSLQSPMSYGGSPLAGSELNNDGGDPNFLKARTRVPQTMQRKTPNARSPLTPKTAAAMANLSMNPQEPYNAQPIRTSGAHHEKAHSGQWVQTPNSLSSFPGSGFSSPLTAGLHSAQINDMLIKGGTSMPAKLSNAAPGGVSSQEAKRKRRRESHNMVERRRRDNINERIQDLSKLVPTHRLEDEKVRKAIQNGTPLSPTLQGISNPSQATSGLAGPGARRATSGASGNITTGLPLEEKDKGPNKGDILNGAVSWMRDLMWMLHLKTQQQEELVNCIVELGGRVPFELTDDERRMQTELLESMAKNEDSGSTSTFSYSRTAGSGLRVPHHTNYKGESFNGSNHTLDHVAVSPDDDIAGAVHVDIIDSAEFVDYDEDGSGGDLNFKDDDYGMDLT